MFLPWDVKTWGEFKVFQFEIEGAGWRECSRGEIWHSHTIPLTQQLTKANIP